MARKAADFNADESALLQTVVIDNGSGYIKAGFAGTSKPRFVTPAIVGRPKYPKVMAGALEGDVFVGTKALEKRGLLQLTHPSEHGVVVDWSSAELLWSSVFDDLKIRSEEHPFLLTEAPLNPRRNRERAAEVFFETFGAPAFLVSTQALLSLYASGRTTGVVLDCGDGVSHAVPVFEGFAIPHAIRRSDLGGRDVTAYLVQLLRRAGRVFHTSAEFETVRMIKESATYVAFNSPIKDDCFLVGADLFDSNAVRNTTAGSQGAGEPASSGPGGGASAGGASGGSYEYQLPDGTRVTLGSERYRAPEILFNPILVGHEEPGVQNLLVGSISSADLELRRELFSSIVLSGGSTLFPGFVERILHETRRAITKDAVVRIYAPPERHTSTFIGGSILASLATFKSMWITRKEFDEEGLSVVHRRSF